MADASVFQVSNFELVALRPKDFGYGAVFDGNYDTLTAQGEAVQFTVPADAPLNKIPGDDTSRLYAGDSVIIRCTNGFFIGEVENDVEAGRVATLTELEVLPEYSRTLNVAFIDDVRRAENDA